MNFERDPADEAFRAEVRSFIAAQPAEIVRGQPLGYIHTREQRVAWVRALNRQGWLVPHWTRAWGGRDWTAMRRQILHDEACAAGCPEIDRIGTDLVGPVLQTFGNPAQQRRFLPGILSGAEFWCQGFSEPQAGSDLSRVRTLAQRDSGGYRVNGRKLWTTQAHLAELMFALVRVQDGDEVQQGLSFLLIDMRSPGITVRPVITLDGGHHVNEVTFEQVAVPAANLVGEEGKGWTYVRSLLENERHGSAGIAHSRRDLLTLERMAAVALRQGRTLAEDPLFQRELQQVRAELAALEYLQLRVLNAKQSDPRTQAMGCVLKFRGAQAYQRVSELLFDAMGEHALEYFGPARPETDQAGIAGAYLFRRTATIAAGTTEIQKNMIAAFALEL